MYIFSADPISVVYTSKSTRQWKNTTTFMITAAGFVWIKVHSCLQHFRNYDTRNLPFNTALLVLCIEFFVKFNILEVLLLKMSSLFT
jgi:hypothetical protein